MSEIRWYPAGMKAPQTVLFSPCWRCAGGQESKFLQQTSLSLKFTSVIWNLVSGEYEQLVLLKMREECSSATKDNYKD